MRRQLIIGGHQRRRLAYFEESEPNRGLNITDLRRTLNLKNIRCNDQEDESGKAPATILGDAFQRLTTRKGQVTMSKKISLYTGVWRTGTGLQMSFSGSPSAVGQKDLEMVPKNLRLIAIDRYETTVPIVHYDQMIGVWRPGTGEQRWGYAMSLDDFKASDAMYFARGLRLTAVDTSLGTIAAVWRPGTGAQHWSTGLSFSEFHALDAKYFAEGLRLAAIDVDDKGHFFGVWRPGKGRQRWASDSFGAIEQKNIQFMNEGLRMVALDHNGAQFVAVWQEGEGAQYWLTGLTIEQFEQRDAQYCSEGLRLVAVNLGMKDVATSPAPSPPTPATRILSFGERKSSTGGDNEWMYYDVTVGDSDPQASQQVITVANFNPFALRLSREGSSGTLLLNANATASFANSTPAFRGHWQVELIGKAKETAPSSLHLTFSIK